MGAQKFSKHNIRSIILSKTLAKNMDIKLNATVVNLHRINSWRPFNLHGIIAAATSRTATAETFNKESAVDISTAKKPEIAKPFIIGGRECDIFRNAILGTPFGKIISPHKAIMAITTKNGINNSPAENMDVAACLTFLAIKILCVIIGSKCGKAQKTKKHIAHSALPLETFACVAGSRSIRDSKPPTLSRANAPIKGMPIIKTKNCKISVRTTDLIPPKVEYIMTIKLPITRL
jgi:hypothetical protein